MKYLIIMAVIFINTIQASVIYDGSTGIYTVDKYGAPQKEKTTLKKIPKKVVEVKTSVHW